MVDLILNGTTGFDRQLARSPNWIGFADQYRPSTACTTQPQAMPAADRADLSG